MKLDENRAREVLAEVSGRTLTDDAGDEVLVSNAVRAMIRFATDALATAPADPRVGKIEANLAWFGEQHLLSLYHYSPVYGDDDDQSVEWRVDRETGSINDREWETVGRGDSPAAAIADARSTLSQIEDRI
jgi:hypothetical protein